MYKELQKLIIGFSVFAFIYIMLYVLMPNRHELTNVLELIVLVPLLCMIFVPKFKSVEINGIHTNNLGLVYFLVMISIMVIGTLNFYVVKFIYPSFDEYISTTNLYWIGGVILFCFGYFSSIKKQKFTNKYHILLKRDLIFFFFIISASATIYSYLNLGFIPFLLGREVRYSVGSNSVIMRLWTLNVLTVILGVNYYFKVKKEFIILFIITLSFIFSFFFSMRMYPFLIGVSIIMLLLKNSKKIIKYGLLFALLYSLFNVMFVEQRNINETNINPIKISPYLNIIQRRIVYQTFNEYQQLNSLINRYDGQYFYGRTFFNIPLGFIPAPLLLPFGMTKSEIQKENSALITAAWLNSQSLGLRVGILGEGFINFGFFGFFIMFFVGVIIAILEKRIACTLPSDMRQSFYIILFSIMLYSLIGQSDAIGSLLGLFIIIMLLIKPFCKRRVIKVSVSKN